MAEQFGLEQLGGDGGAVHFHERTAAERAGIVNVGGQQLFAGTALRLQQNIGPAAGRLPRLLQGRQQHRRAADDRVPGIFFAEDPGPLRAQPGPRLGTLQLRRELCTG